MELLEKRLSSTIFRKNLQRNLLTDILDNKSLGLPVPKNGSTGTSLPRGKPTRISIKKSSTSSLPEKASASSRSRKETKSSPSSSSKSAQTSSKEKSTAAKTPNARESVQHLCRPKESRTVLLTGSSRKSARSASNEVSIYALSTRNKLLPSLSKETSKNVLTRPSRKSQSKITSRASSKTKRVVASLSKEECRNVSLRSSKRSPLKELSVAASPKTKKIVSLSEEESRDASPTRKLGKSPFKNVFSDASSPHAKKCRSMQSLSEEESNEFSPSQKSSSSASNEVSIYTLSAKNKLVLCSSKGESKNNSPIRTKSLSGMVSCISSPKSKKFMETSSTAASPKTKWVSIDVSPTGRPTRKLGNVFNKTPQKELSNDDSPLPSPLKSLGLSNKRLSFGSQKRRSPRRTPKKNSCYFHHALDKVLNEMQDGIKQDLELQKLEEKLHHVISDSHVRRGNGELTARFTEPEGDRTQELPPGLKVLEPTLCFRFFSDIEDILDLDEPFMSDNPTTFETMLSNLSPDFLPEFVVRGGFLQSPSVNLNPNPGILMFLLRLMSIHEGKDVVNSCQNAFKHFASTCEKEFRWCPALDDVVSIFLNFGMLVSSIRDHCPLKEFLLAVHREVSEGRLQNLEATLHDCHCKRKHSKMVADYYNLRAVLESLGFCIRKWNTYCNSHLCDLILLLCWLAMDKQLLLEDITLALKRCIAISLSSIAEEEWLNKLAYLSEELRKLGGHHHHNALYIMRLLPQCSRGLQLQQSTAFASIQSLMGVQPTIDTVVTPKKILKFLRDKPLDDVEDYYLLYSIISMLEIAVGNYIAGYEAVVQALGHLLMTVFSIISDSLLRTENTQLKSLLVTIRSKWVFMVQASSVLKMNGTSTEHQRESDIPAMKKAVIEMPRSPAKLATNMAIILETQNENIPKISPVKCRKFISRKLPKVTRKNGVSNGTVRRF